MSRLLTLLALLALAAVVQLATPVVLAQDKYRDFNDAMSQGARLLRDMQFAAAQEPLEAALKLAADDQARVRVYQALRQPYRQLPEIDKMLEAQEFILRHTAQKAGRSLAARDLASFLQWWEENRHKKSIQVAGGVDAAQIITIHKSKGLQFEYVIVPFLSWELNHGTKAPILWCTADRGVFKEAGYLIPENANTWVSHVFDWRRNPDGTYTYWGATGDFNIGLAGRSAVDVYETTLPPPPPSLRSGIGSAPPVLKGRSYWLI